MATREGVWTFEDRERLEIHHEYFERKFEFLRNKLSEGIPKEDAIQDWIENQEDIISELMPSHPLLDELRGK